MDSSDQYPDAHNPAPPLEPWPRCPECQAPRLTHCPFCHTVGRDFVEADPRFTAPPPKPRSSDETARRVMVLCPTCDEPFFPTFADQCPWCGHRFPDGYAVDELGEDPEEAASRATAVLMGFLAWLLALVLYLAWRF